jgi:hypothetical protein
MVSRLGFDALSALVLALTALLGTCDAGCGVLPYPTPGESPAPLPLAVQ